MKNVLIAVITITLGLSILNAGDDNPTREHSGIFVGIDNMGTINYLFSENQKDLSAKNSFNPNIGVKAGYQYHLNAYSGVQVYGHFNYRNLFSKDGVVPSLIHYGAKLDYLLNFPSSRVAVEIFVGVGHKPSAEKADTGNSKRFGEPNISLETKTNDIFMDTYIPQSVHKKERIEFGAKFSF